MDCKTIELIQCSLIWSIPFQMNFGSGLWRIQSAIMACVIISVGCGCWTWSPWLVTLKIICALPGSGESSPMAAIRLSYFHWDALGWHSLTGNYRRTWKVATDPWTGSRCRWYSAATAAAKKCSVLLGDCSGAPPRVAGSDKSISD
jgi:hypothetical protein